MKIVEIAIDLRNPNEKIIFKFYDVTRETEKLYIHEYEEYDYSIEDVDISVRRFKKDYLEHIEWKDPLHMYCRYLTHETDYFKIMKSEKSKQVEKMLYDKLKENLEYCLRTLEYRHDRFLRNYGHKED